MNSSVTRTAALLIVLAVACLSMHDAIARQMVQGLPVVVVIWVRYLGQTLVMGSAAISRRSLAAWTCRRPGLHFLRAFFLVALSLCFIGGLRFVPLAEATALNFLAPLFVLVLSKLFFSEAIRPSQWIAVLVGLLGVALVVNPAGELFTWAALLPCGAAFFLSCYQLATRAAANQDTPESATLWLGLFALALCSAMLPWFWEAPSALQWLGLSGMALVGTTAHWLFAAAYSRASPARLAPFTYVQIPCSALLGYLMYSTFPDVLGWWGISMILISGLMVILPSIVRGARSSEQESLGELR
ncbi:DMT family transporter [Pantoea sp. Ap-967]|uniref:DMT family transporter n=1 Tax=Pantoea sp. Ap-967 TaxID=2608362 RepID=UPI00141E39D3|nr:DMT family transporter [Pantoea sp. Ap-967]NIE75938.1 DMT family transporter [Pantoea sp. Ap-967]